MISRATLTFAASAAVLTGGIGAFPAPALAQSNVSEVIVYGNDPCPRSTESEVVVCARKPEAERYRLPEKYRPSGPPQVRESWANKARQLETVGATGTMSCSPVGPGGFTGCLTQLIKTARQQQRQAAEDNQPPPE